PVEIWVNGSKVFSGAVTRSALTALTNARARGDERLIDAAVISVEVPSTPAAAAAAERAFATLTPKHAVGTLSFWEMFARRALEERMRTCRVHSVEEPLPSGVKSAPEQVAIRVQQIAPSSPLAG